VLTVNVTILVNADSRRSWACVNSKCNYIGKCWQ